MKKIHILALAISLLSSVVNANGVTITGARSCGDWVSNRQKNNNNWREIVSSNWLSGFLSGVALEKNKDFLSDTDNESLNIWMDNYCKSHPLNDISDGGRSLVIELMNQKGIK